MIKNLYLKILMHINPVKAVKKLGVKIKQRVGITGVVTFESEPWLIIMDRMR